MGLVGWWITHRSTIRLTLVILSPFILYPLIPTYISRRKKGQQ